MERNQERYFERYCDPSTLRWASALRSKFWNHVCVVPARCEQQALPQLLNSLERAAAIDERVLIILILNSPESSNEDELHEQRLCAETITSDYDVEAIGEDWSLLRGNSLDVFLIDRWSPGRQLSSRQGVGTARKLGADLASHLHGQGQVQNHFFLSTDADALVPKDYFKALQQLSPKHSLGVYDFAHRPEGCDAQKEAMHFYESWLHHYKEGLRGAGSPYAHMSLGSVFAINFKSYIQARGFPQRPAGEDFYLMNKLRKIGLIEELRTVKPILLSGRISHRTPYGTGPGIEKIIFNLKSESLSPFYHPKCFEVLAHFLTWASKWIDDPQSRSEPNALIPENFIDFAVKARNLKSFHDSFDGFQTLKLIHSLRDRHFPNLSWKEAKELIYVRSGWSSFFPKIA